MGADMRVSLLCALFALLTADVRAERLHVQVLGAPPPDAFNGVTLGAEEMARTAQLLGNVLTVTARPASARARLAGYVVNGGATAGRPNVPAIHLGSKPPEARCAFSIAARGAGATRDVAWHAELSRFGASELNERYFKRFGTPMTAAAWTGWFAVKALVETALRSGGADACAALSRARFDGHKGTPLFFDPATHELQQPMYAYVSNELAGTVSVIDTAKDTVVRTITVGGRPRGIEAHGSQLYVATSDTNRERRGADDAIVVVDAASGRIVRKYDAGTDPERFVVSGDGRRLFAANEDAGTVTVTAIPGNTVRAALVVGIEPEGVALSPDGRWVYVTAETSNTVSVIDAAALKVVRSLMVDPRPRSVAFAPDGSRAYVTAEIGGTVTVIDARRHKTVDTIELAPGARPVGVVVSPDGRWVYVANGHANSVAIVDAASLETVATVPVGQRPWGLALTADGRKLYAANGVSGDVSVIDTSTRREVKRIPTGAGAWGVAVTASQGTKALTAQNRNK